MDALGLQQFLDLVEHYFGETIRTIMADLDQEEGTEEDWEDGEDGQGEDGQDGGAGTEDKNQEGNGGTSPNKKWKGPESM